MEFVKRNYEKMILILVFIVCIIAMIFEVDMAHQSRSVSEESLMIPRRAADHVKADPSDEKFDAQQIVNKHHLEWAPRKDGDFPSYLVVFPRIYTCPHDNCGRLIPDGRGGNAKANFSCPECGEIIAGDQLVELRKLATVGMVLNPTETENPDEDSDGDGFINRWENTYRTDAKSSFDHPGYWYLLKVDGKIVAKSECYKEIFTAVLNTKSDKSSWEALFKGELDGHKIGDECSLDGRKFIVRDIRLDACENATTHEKQHELVLEEVLEPGVSRQPTQVTMRTNEKQRKTRSFGAKLVTIRPINGGSDNLMFENLDLDSEFEIGSDRYKVVDCDEHANTVTLLRTDITDGTAQKLVVGEQSKAEKDHPVTTSN